MTNDEMLKAMYEDMQGMKADMKDMKADMNDMKADISGLKSDVSSLKSDVKSLNEKVEKIDNRVRNVELSIENEVIPQIKMVAESHLELDRKINELNDKTNKAQEQDELKDIKLTVLETQVKKLQEG